MVFFYSKRIHLSSIIITMMLTMFFSCKKNTVIPIGNITGPTAVCYGERRVIYFIEANPSADYILWKVPEQAQIVSGQGTNKIVLDFGRKAGNICVNYYSKGEEISAASCLGVSFDVVNKWCREIDFKGGQRVAGVGFSIGGKGYIGTGYDQGPPLKILNDLWEFDPAINTWTQKTDLPAGERVYAFGFSIGSKGYIGAGGNDINSTWFNDFWEYDPTTNSWSQKAGFDGLKRKYAFSFSIGNKGYVGSGSNNIITGNLSDFYEYDQITGLWTPKAFTIPPRVDAVGFSIGNKGYVGTGKGGTSYLNDLWEYNPVLDSWIQKTNFTGGIRSGAVGFSINNKGYLGTGFDGTNYYNNFFEYDPGTNNWTALNDTIEEKCQKAVGFAIGNKGYVGTGTKLVGSISKFWVYSK